MYSTACRFFQPNFSLNVVNLRKLLLGATFWISISQTSFENVLMECRSDHILTVNFTTNLTSLREARSISSGYTVSSGGRTVARFRMAESDVAESITLQKVFLYFKPSFVLNRGKNKKNPKVVEKNKLTSIDPDRLPFEA